jgi:hypothetical protein
MGELDKTVVVERIKEVDGTPTWVAESVSPLVTDDFAIDENRLDREICRLGHLMAYYGNLAAELKAELARKEEQLKRAYAISAQAIRAECLGKGEKVTDPSIKEKVEVGERYGNQQAGLQITRLYAIMAESWFQSMKKKADLVIALAYKQGREVKAYDQGG